MQTGWRVIAVGLLGAIVAALPGGLAAAVFPENSAGHPAGCHGHGPATPSPAPISYQCCVNGHHAALPNASFTNRSVQVRVCGLAVAQQLRLDSASDRFSVMFVVPSNSPPGAAPLRI
jgi:hypothetical protein